MNESFNGDAARLEQLLARLSLGGNSKAELGPHQVASGLTACYLNCRGLVDDSRVLARNGSHARSLSLSILALEEFAKIPDLFDTYIEHVTKQQPGMWKEFWDRFSRHRPKQQRASRYGDKLRRIAQLDDNVLRIYSRYMTENSTAHLDSVKQAGFYVDFRNDRFRVPGDSPEVRDALNILFAFVEERCDMISSWGSTRILHLICLPT